MGAPLQTVGGPLLPENVQPNLLQNPASHTMNTRNEGKNKI